MIKRSIALGTAGLALLATVGFAGTANADSDSYSQHSTTLNGFNYYSGGIFGSICNNQSSPNSFYIWVTDAYFGFDIISKRSTGTLQPGWCFPVSAPANGDPIQVFGESSGNWTYGTDPIYPS